VLKLRATFVPFDLGYPAAQLALMLEDAAPSLILFDEAGAELAAALSGNILGQSLSQLGRASDDTSATHGPAPTISGLDTDAGVDTDVAYVMFTSGSQGRPKGVMVPHRGILRLVHEQSYARFGPDETFLHMSPLAFDASTFELWGALLNGGTVAILSTPRPALAEIGETIRTHGVTTAWMTAGLFHAMVDRRLSDLSPLRQLLTGGDVISPEHVRRAQAALPHCQIINGYGPTENTTFTCCYRVPAAGFGAGSVPIGKPLRGTTVYVLDSELRPVADGEAGQLATGGDGVAVGYIARPELTAERFVQVRHAGDELLYLTGDKVRKRSDGSFEFLGRIDRQLKIDGKRIELDEIEAALRRCTGVADAAVLAHEAVLGQKRLTAYVTFVSRAADALAHAEITRCKAELAIALPQHMLPSVYIALADMPLNPQGKLDRAHLPIPSAQPSPRASIATAQLSALEREILQAWATILGTSEIDPDQNIFDLGGTSLHVVRIHELLTQRHPDLKLGTFFEKPSVRALAIHLSFSHSSPSVQAGASVRDRAAKQAEAIRRMRGSDPSRPKQR
jgi:amino acid adenylation domain-containing protein